MTLRVPRNDGRVSILYLAPWVDFGGWDKGTIDWFRWMDRDRFRVSLVTTQPSPSRRMADIEPYADEVWPLPEMAQGDAFPAFICDFLASRQVDVLHIMNSRLGYELLPDLASLPRPPATVVQLHVEEENRSGYVRYVTTRYGNLVDAFSLSSQHLAEAVVGYGVHRSRCHVIPTGIDAEGEFCRERVKPVAGLEEGPIHILYPGRLVEQKDPLLMVKVAAALKRRGADFRVHVVGDGPLEQQVRASVRSEGLDSLVRFHAYTPEIARWYRASDLVLMTSRFEGVPYVLYEAMAMGVPVVAPALPGNIELLEDQGTSLVEDRSDPDAYAEALSRLAADPADRGLIGSRGQTRARTDLSVRRMADQHAELYELLLAGQPTPAGGLPLRQQPPLRLRNRPTGRDALVSVIVPCFDHGRYLPECLDAIRGQTYPHLEIIVVDDGSTDPDTVELLDNLQNEPDLTVIRLRDNKGPSAARNAALDLASGRYVLPVDSDNILLPRAVELLVNQLQVAGEQVGYIYPNLQFFGNRDDYFEAPDYNLYNLVHGNFCDTSSLFDRELFDAGLRFAEDIKLGHEDWDLALQLAERQVRGEPAREKTLLFRKWGFTRSDKVESLPVAFATQLQNRHPALYAPERLRALKARWAPALSIVVLSPLDSKEEAGERVMQRLGNQTLVDLELVGVSPSEWPASETGPVLRRMPPDLARTPAQALETGLRLARGRYVLVTLGKGLDLLADRAFGEKVVREFQWQPACDVLAFADAQDRGHFRFRLLTTAEAGPETAVHALAWSAGEVNRLPPGLEVSEARPLSDLVAALIADGAWLQCRHLPSPPVPPASTSLSAKRRVEVEYPRRSATRVERRRRLRSEPMLPALPSGSLRQGIMSAGYRPPHTLPLCRHRALRGRGRIVTTDPTAPAGFTFERHLGSIQAFSVQGTRPLARAEGPTYRLLESSADCAPGERVLGHLEVAPLPLFEPLSVAWHPPSSAYVLLSGRDDPLLAGAQAVSFLGFIEPYPVLPRQPPHEPLHWGLAGLTRAVDRRARRHRYAVGALACGDDGGELGALHLKPGRGSVPLWVSAAGRVSVGGYEPEVRSPTLADAARHALAPLSWRDVPLTTPVRARASLRRTAEGVFHLWRPQGSGGADQTKRGADRTKPAGYLRASDGPRRLPLFGALHPVTGDQLLTREPSEAASMGYVDTRLVGYLEATGPVTGTLDQKRPMTPWASRFGQTVRSR